MHMRIQRTRQFLPFTLLITSIAWAQPYAVVAVTDGDTVKVLGADKQQIKCRLHGIDAPEKH